VTLSADEIAGYDDYPAKVRQLLDAGLQLTRENLGTLLAFRRSNNSWHGHKPFAGPRRVIQFNWVTSEAVVRREQNRHRFSAWMKKLRGALSGEKQAA
jgi:hypothetical protein